MRRLVLAAAAALAACSVALEGAPCATDANCPDSQRCDGAGVQPGRCVACQADPACTADGFTCTGLHAIRECRTNAGACRYSLTIDCGPLTCVPTSPNASCPCPASVGDLLADAVQGTAGAPFNPTGLSSPAQCRYRRLGDALAAASSGRTVRMAGSTGSEVKFSGAATGESFPLSVKAGVTLTTADSSPVPANYVVEVDQAGNTRPVLQMDHDASASGFTVRPGAGGSASDAIVVSCTGAGAVNLSSLVLDGKGALAAGTIGDALHLKGPCSVNAAGLLVENATAAGILVETSFPLGGTAPTVAIGSSTIRGNGDSGLVVNVDASNGRPALHVTGNDITLNRAVTPYTDAAAGATRRGGGVVLLAAAPAPLVFTGNRVHGNAYDQVLVYSSDPGWTLSGSACDATANVLACYDTTTASFGLAVLGGATVTASFDSWSHAVPAAGMDYYKTAASTVSTGTACAVSTLTCP